MQNHRHPPDDNILNFMLLKFAEKVEIEHIERLTQ